MEGNSVKVVVYTLTPHTLGSIRAGQQTLIVRDADGFADSDPVLVEGAGALGGDLLTSISAVSGNTITLADAARESVSRARVGRRVDPSTAEFKLKRPDGTIDTFTHPDPAIAHPVAGKYVLTYTPPPSPLRHGLYLVRFVGTGVAAGAEELAFRLTPSGIE
jgi:hypothetical protein